jgi:hypothetical protein
LSDGGNSYDGQAYVDGGDSDEHSNEDWALWDENDYYFCKIPFHAPSG